MIASGGVDNMSANITPRIIMPLGGSTHVGVAVKTANTSGTPIGIVTIQISNDNETWVTITGTGSSVTITGNQTAARNVCTQGFKWMRPVYTFTSGDGQLDVVVHKQPGSR